MIELRGEHVVLYGLEGKWFSDGDGMCGTLGSHHRTLSTYLNTLSASRFQLEEVSEPLAPVLDGTAKHRESIVPTLLIAKSIALAT